MIFPRRQAATHHSQATMYSCAPSGRAEYRPDSARFYHPARDHSGRAMNDAEKPFLFAFGFGVTSRSRANHLIWLVIFRCSNFD